jgi:transcriptional regulator with XRE-family HTH domain
LGQVIHIAEMAKKLRSQILENAPNRIRELRMARGWSLRELAERAGTTSESQISRFETGERPVDMPWLQRIARALDLPVGDLLNPEDNPNAAMDDRERAVLESMRRGEEIAGPVLRVAESLSQYRAEPAQAEPEAPRKRA